MTFRGKVKNGVIVLEPPAELPEGAEVIVQAVDDKPWMKCAGTITEEDALEMLKYIEETCERIETPKESS